MLAAEATPPPAHRYDTRIARDRWGVPHVFGTTDADVAYGIGYAHSEDDFSTIAEVLAMTRGRLGAMKGSDGAKTDFVVHLLNARATVDRDYDKQPADVRALLDAYASGVNLYARRHPEEVPLRKLFPVDGKDVATGFVLRSPFFFGLDNVLGALAGDKPVPLDRAIKEPDAPAITPVGPEGRENGSNAFLIAPKRSADGATRMVSNSHQPWRGGVAWYELVVHSKAGWNFAGATFPGAPYPLLGHNQHSRLDQHRQPPRPDRRVQADHRRRPLPDRRGLETARTAARLAARSNCSARSSCRSPRPCGAPSRAR